MGRAALRFVCRGFASGRSRGLSDPAHARQSRGFASTVAKEWNGVLPRSPLPDFRTADELLSVALAPQRLAAAVFGAFGLMAIVLASVGIYSAMAYAVARRTREIGIRLAMGAKPALVVRQILGKSMAVAGAGVAAGISISALLARFVAPQVKGSRFTMARLSRWSRRWSEWSHSSPPRFPRGGPRVSTPRRLCGRSDAGARQRRMRASRSTTHCQPLDERRLGDGHQRVLVEVTA